MKRRISALLAFPNPVDEVAARTVASGVVLMSVLAMALGVPWLLVPLAYGFWARVLTGPSLSPLGQLATRVVAPVLPLEARPTPGPPKRFAQGIGAALSSAAIVVWATDGWGVAKWLVGALAVAAFFEAAFGFCLGCRTFSLLMRVRLIPASVCEECADLSKRHSELAPRRLS